MLEAALLKVPVLVMEAGPLAELPDIPTMSAGNAVALADWCLEMARDQKTRRQLGGELRKVVCDRHDPHVVASQVEAIYDQLVPRFD